MSEELGTPLRRWLRSARTRRQVAKALGGGNNPNESYMRMATSVLNFLWTDAINQPHTDPTWPEKETP